MWREVFLCDMICGPLFGKKRFRLFGFFKGMVKKNNNSDMRELLMCKEKH